MRFFFLLKQKIDFFKTEMKIGIEFIVGKSLFYFSIIVGILYIVKEIKYNLTYIVAFLLLQFDRILTVISFYIIPNKNIIFLSILSLLSIIILSYISYKFIDVIKYFKYYINRMQTNINKIKIFVINNFNKQIFKKTQIFVAKVSAHLAYNILIYIWDRVKDFSIFGNYKILRKRIIENVKLIKKYFSPMLYLIAFIKSKTIILFTKQNLTENEENLFLLMDEGKQLTKTEDIPDSLIALLSDNMVEDKQITEQEANILPIILEEWQETIIDAIQRWESGNISSLLITGSMGSGKTTLLKYIKQTNQNHKVEYYKLDRKSNILNSNFFLELLNTPFDQFDTIEKQIILFDDIEHLFLSMIGGFEPIKKFFILMERTKEKILWIATTTSTFFAFQNKIFPMETIFQKRLTLDNFNTNFLLSVYENKLKGAGYQFYILKNKKIEKTIKKNIRHKVIAKNEISYFLKRNYFEESFDLGNSNFYFYNFYFLRSIKYIQNNKLFLTSPDFLEIPNLEERTIEELFILKVILLHKSLTKEEIEQILLFPSAFVSITLSLFYETNLIQKKDDKFMIYGPVYSQIVSFLKTKNLID